MFRNEEAGLCLEGFLDALSDGMEDFSEKPSKLRTPVSSPALGRATAVKDADARIKADLAEYRALMVNRGDFEEVAVLGRGQFATVSLVREKVSVHATGEGASSSGGKVYAMKRMSKSIVSASRAKMERTIMSKAKADWIVKLRFAFQDSRFLYLVMEYCPGGDLRTLLDR